jgi:MFS family permease
VWAASAPYLGGLVGLYVGSWLSDKTGKRVLVTAIFCLTGALFLVVLAFTYNKLEVVAVLGMVIFSLSLMGPNAYALLQGVCTSKLTCSATGILNGLSNGVGFLGPIILGLVVAITGSYQLGLPIMAGFMVLGAVIVLRFRVLENPLYEQVMSPPVEK